MDLHIVDQLTSLTWHAYHVMDFLDEAEPISMVATTTIIYDRPSREAIALAHLFLIPINEFPSRSGGFSREVLGSGKTPSQRKMESSNWRTSIIMWEFAHMDENTILKHQCGLVHEFTASSESWDICNVVSSSFPGQLQLIIPWRKLELLHGIRHRPTK
ncbi:hypothetical protein Tco_1250043 [Tanacetum coccineum]